jgi:hypothetical protein
MLRLLAWTPEDLEMSFVPMGADGGVAGSRGRAES